MLKFIVISDSHLMPEGQLSNSIDTNARLVAAVNYVTTTHSDAAFCIMNGDLVDMGDVDAYSALKSILKTLKIPVYFTLGNHDDARAFETVFGADMAVFDHVIEADGQHILVLNSQDQGKVTGRLEEAQLAWLEAELTRAKGKPVLITLHHPIGNFGIGLDFLNLQNPEPLLALLKDHGDVRQVISGHIHTTATGVIEGIPVTTLAGNHYSFAPFSDPDISDMTRIDGPGEIGVVLTDAKSTIVHFDKFHDKNNAMPSELFVWNG